MSARYPGGFITKTPTAPTSSAAPGIWTLDQAMQNQKAGNWPSGFAPYIEDVFSTYLYTGNGSTQTITNGIDLSTKGGLVWTKSRSVAGANSLYDTARGIYQQLTSNGTGAQSSFSPGGLTAFNTTGFSVFDDAAGNYGINGTGTTYTSWTFREQAKFFDIVTLTANGSGDATFSHNLGSTPGCVILKRTDGISSWYVWHRSLTSTNYSIQLQSTAAQADNGFAWITPSASTISINGGFLGASTQWVAYLFAHDAGGFGLTGADNVISCGSFTNDASGNATVTLGYEPQWIMYKRTDAVGNWVIVDSMRGFTVGADSLLFPNLSAVEDNTGNNVINPTATGFYTFLNPSTPYIYIAIRRGPMKVPTLGTTVFSPIARSGTGASTTVNTTVRPDSIFQNWRAGAYGSSDHYVYDRLRGFTFSLFTNLTSAEVDQTVAGTSGMGNSSYGILNTGMNASGGTFVDYAFTRAPGFFDQVCYTGTGANTTVTHNLGVAPEMMIIKSRSNGALGWYVYSTGLGPTKCNLLNQTNGQFTSSTYWNDTAPTSSVFTLGSGGTNGSGNTQVAYLFATCPGVSKVGSYTGNGSSQTINCGFTTGSRFILIKRTDTTSDWYVWDSARGIVAGNDPYLLLNSTAAEVTGTDAVDTDSTGFIVNRLVAVDVNENAGTYIFLAIA